QANSSCSTSLHCAPAHTNPKRKRGRKTNLPSLTLRVSVRRAAAQLRGWCAMRPRRLITAGGDCATFWADQHGYQGHYRRARRRELDVSTWPPRHQLLTRAVSGWGRCERSFLRAEIGSRYCGSLAQEL